MCWFDILRRGMMKNPLADQRFGGTLFSRGSLTGAGNFCGVW